MKILKIEPDITEGLIKVTVEDYPHAQPVFDANITAAELEVKLKEWRAAQDAVDAINVSAQPTIKTEVKTELKNLIGKEIT